jgi:hypothetical protein
MEGSMFDRDQVSPRRSFLGRIAGGATALVAGAGAAAAAPVLGDGLLAQGDEEWLRRIHGSHRQYFDATGFNGGFPFYYAFNWAKTTKDTYKVGNADVCAVIGLRHFGIGPAFNDALWAKYKLGAFFKIDDPKTKAPAVRNFMNSEAQGDLMFPGSSLRQQVQDGAMVTVCNLATTALSGMTAAAAGLSIKPEDAYAEWKAALLPGCYLVPSGVLAVNRAQKSGGCTYCYAG